MWQTDSVGSVYSYLPRGCQICRQGAGMVLFVTGRCERECFYCPISAERRGRDLVFADEQPVGKPEEILDEARAIGALGTGITGGEPLLRLDFILECLALLKRELGREHHVHLYTGILPPFPILKRLRLAGLDEIRFHPPASMWKSPAGLREALRAARSLGMEAGVEIPALAPAPEIVEAVRSEDAFLNLNQLEFSETNLHALRQRGFQPEDLCFGAAGSEQLAREHFLLEGVKVHYCPSRFKDAVQLRERLKRRAERVARPFDLVTDDGTLIHGIICGDMAGAWETLRELGVPERMYCRKKDRIEIAAAILEEISKELKGAHCHISLVERYPLEGGLVVERIPL
jgi:pyruvate formate-lyase activating enzyme-like uncharacterized protein